MAKWTVFTDDGTFEVDADRHLDGSDFIRFFKGDEEVASFAVKLVHRIEAEGSVKQT